MEKKKYAIGIDPGTNTGVAVRQLDNDTFIDVRTMGIIEAIHTVKEYHDNGGCFVFIENPMLRQWYGKTGRERLQGAGSVKRDFRIWQTQLMKYNIPFKDIAPKQIVSLPPGVVQHKWEGRTSEHARDAMSLALRDPNLFTKP